MIGDVVNLGDNVIVKVSKENRDWGFNPCPDGTIAEVISFGEIDYGYINNHGREPGVYENRCWFDIRLPDGKEVNISCCHVEPVDAKAYEAKVTEWRQTAKASGDWSSAKRLRDLPETKLWPGDYVTCSHLGDYEELRVAYIKYNYIGQKRTDGSDMPLYDVSNKFPSGWTMAAGDDDTTLIRRGNVWKYYHKEPMEFLSLEEEANLFRALGRTREVRNPANGIYRWTKDEVLDAIQSGLAHAFSMSGRFFGLEPTESAIRFLDEDLGKRVAALTLKGFGR